MYAKGEASAIKQAFWTAFGQYMALTTNAAGDRVNWINYKTGIKHLYFKMQADQKSAYMGIEMSHPDKGMQELVFEQFREYQQLLTSALGEDWTWELHGMNDQYKTVSRIYTRAEGLSIFKKEDWPELISFFKPRMVALDEFWSDAQYSFEVFK